jgi:site-specific recombinase XerD
MTPLRQRMIDDMKVRNMSVLTQKAYVRSVKNFAAFHGRSPDGLTFEDVRSYQFHLIARGLQPQTLNQIICALRFFYAVTLGEPEAKTALPLARHVDKLPAVLSPAEVGTELRPSSARSLHRVGRRHLDGRNTLDSLPARLLPPGAGALAPVPGAVPGRPRRAACRGQVAVLRRPGFA